MRPTGSLHGQAMRTLTTISEASFARLPAALALTAIWAGAPDAHRSGAHPLLTGCRYGLMRISRRGSAVRHGTRRSCFIDVVRAILSNTPSSWSVRRERHSYGRA